MTVDEPDTVTEVPGSMGVEEVENVIPAKTGAQPKAVPAEPTVRVQRERKQADIFKPPVKAAKKGPKLTPGDGSALRDIDYVKANFDKLAPAEDILKQLHRVLFGSEGKHTMRKKELLNFQGFNGEHEDGTDATEFFVERAKKVVSTLTNTGYNTTLDLLGLPRGTGEEASKEAKATRILEFLSKPQGNGKKVPARKSVTPKKATAAAKKDKVPAKAKAVAKKRKSSDEDEDEEKDNEEEAAPAKKRAKTVATPKKAAPKKPAAKTKKEVAAVVEDDDDEDLPMGDIAKMPNDEALSKAVDGIMDNEADPSKISFKTLKVQLMETQGLSEAFLKTKKTLIKEFALKYIQKAAGQVAVEEKADVEPETKGVDKDEDNGKAADEAEPAAEGDGINEGKDDDEDEAKAADEDKEDEAKEGVDEVKVADDGDT